MRLLIPLFLTPLTACAPKISELQEPAVATAEVPPGMEDGVVTQQEYLDNNARVVDALERLSALQLLDVGELLVDVPVTSDNCYGLPCDSPEDDGHREAHARQTVRLEAFVDAAEEIATANHGESTDVTNAISALTALEIVEIRGAQTGNCYGPCPGDASKIATIQAIADATEGI